MFALFLPSKMVLCGIMQKNLDLRHLDTLEMSSSCMENFHNAGFPSCAVPEGGCFTFVNGLIPCEYIMCFLFLQNKYL